MTYHLQWPFVVRSFWIRELLHPNANITCTGICIDWSMKHIHEQQGVVLIVVSSIFQHSRIYSRRCAATSQHSSQIYSICATHSYLSVFQSLCLYVCAFVWRRIAWPFSIRLPWEPFVTCIVFFITNVDVIRWNIMIYIWPIYYETCSTHRIIIAKCPIENEISHGVGLPLRTHIHRNSINKCHIQ